MTIIKYELEFFLGTSISGRNSVENYLIKILAGIMEGMGAYYEKPIDKQVYINKKFITHLPTRQKVAYPVKKSLYIKAKRAIEKIRKMMK